MENIILSNGKYLNRLYGKYQPNLVLISPEPLPENWKMELSCELPEKFNNLKFDGSIYVHKGFFRISKKGNPTFELGVANPTHLMIIVDWGGCFNDSRGYCLTPNVEFTYHRRASSNGGGMGYDYYVIPVDYKLELTENDF